MLLLVIDIELVLAYIRFVIKILLFDLVSIFSIPVKNKTGQCLSAINNQVSHYIQPFSFFLCCKMGFKIILSLLI